MNERVLALDEILPNRSNQYDSSPGVYIRSDKDRELDVLWQGYRVNSKEEKSPVVYLAIGFIAGIVGMLIMSAIFSIGNSAKMDIFGKANTKSATAISVVPSIDENNPVLKSTAEYKVKNGDTLEKIAYRFYGNRNPSKINRIKDANSLKNANELKIGQKLVIPIDN